MSYLYKKFRAKAKKKRTPSLYKKALALLWSVTSVYVRMREVRRNGGKCFVCGQGPVEVAYHFIPSRWLAIKYHLDNLCGACKPCNFGEMIQRGSAHDDVVRAAHVRMVGEERVRWLEEHKRDLWKKTPQEILEMKREIEAKMAKGEWE